MPRALDWTAEQDETIRTMRTAGESWGKIAARLGRDAMTVYKRGEKIGARGHCQRLSKRGTRMAIAREAMPAGDPTSWGILTAGTTLAGTAYPGL